MGGRNIVVNAAPSSYPLNLVFAEGSAVWLGCGLEDGSVVVINTDQGEGVAYSKSKHSYVRRYLRLVWVFLLGIVRLCGG